MGQFTEVQRPTERGAVTLSVRYQEEIIQIPSDFMNGRSSSSSTLYTSADLMAGCCLIDSIVVASSSDFLFDEDR